jgi:hypothetical protein
VVAFLPQLWDAVEAILVANPAIEDDAAAGDIRP